MNKKLLRRRSRDDDSGRHFSQCSSSNKFRATGFLIGLGIAVVLSQGAVVLTGDTSLPARAIQLKQLNMTTLIFNLSSWTNDGLSVLGEPNANTTGMTELATTSGKKETTVVDLPRKNRSIVMVHVGKCGGSSKLIVLRVVFHTLS